MSISPPPVKRRRLEQPLPLTNHHLTVYSWNVNGIDPLLQTSVQDFFSPARLNSRDSHAPLSPIREFLRRHNWPTLCFLQEIKIPAGDEVRMRAVRRAVSNKADTTLPTYEAHFCLPAKDRFTTSRGAGRFYGVCTLIRSDYADRVVDQTRTVDWDNEGRILIVETRSTAEEPRLAIINVYMVNGTDLPYRPVAGGNTKGTRHDRKLQMHALLQAECARLEEAGFAVIIAGDINIARTALDGYPRLRTYPVQHVHNRADFEQRFFADHALDSSQSEAARSKSSSQHLGTADRDRASSDRAPNPHVDDNALSSPASATNKRSAWVSPVLDVPLCQPLGMHDTFRALHPKKRGYSYFSRGVDFGDSCDRVDMIIVSKHIISSCVQAGMHETQAERGTSDHVPIFAVFDWSSLQST